MQRRRGFIRPTAFPVLQNDTGSIIMDGNAGNKMKDTGVQDLSPESCNKPSGDIFVFRYLFCRKKAWYTEQNNLEFVEKNPMKKNVSYPLRNDPLLGKCVKPESFQVCGDQRQSFRSRRDFSEWPESMLR